MASTKNQLQQFLQKLKLDLPEYFSSKTDEGLWISKVKFVLSEDNVLEYIGEPFKRKTQAECSAAFKAIKNLDCIKKTETSYNVDHVEWSPGARSVYILVDYENINKISGLEKFAAQNDKIKLLKFAGHCHPKALAGHSNYVIESSIKDAVDHYISFYIGKLVYQHQQQQSSGTDRNLLVLVLTRDHYASSYESFTNDKTINIIHCASESKCLTHLS